MYSSSKNQRRKTSLLRAIIVWFCVLAPILFFMASKSFGLLHVFEVQWFAAHSQTLLWVAGLLTLLTSFVLYPVIRDHPMPNRMGALGIEIQALIIAIFFAVSSTFSLFPYGYTIIMGSPDGTLSYTVEDLYRSGARTYGCPYVVAAVDGGFLNNICVSRRLYEQLSVGRNVYLTGTVSDIGVAYTSVTRSNPTP